MRRSQSKLPLGCCDESAAQAHVSVLFCLADCSRQELKYFRAHPAMSDVCRTAASTTQPIVPFLPPGARLSVSSARPVMRLGPACLLWALPCGGLQSLTHGSACHSSVGGRDHGGTCHAQNCHAGRSEEDAGREGEESDRRVCVQSYCVGVAFSRGRGLCDSVLDSSHAEDAIDVPTERVRKRLLFMTRA